VPGGGWRRPYWRIDEKVSQRRFCCSESWNTNGAHLGNELVRLVFPASATPGVFARPSAAGCPAAGGRDIVQIVAVGSESASHSIP
jgi:hypothetical protein